MEQGTQDRKRWWLLHLLLIICYFAARLPSLREMPVFCDEATYLRWAQLIRQDPWRNLLTSMQDAKLPLHYWLLALTRPMHADPVYAGRLLSVILGALALVVLPALCHELCRLMSPDSEVLPPQRRLFERLFAPVVALFFIFSPLVSFYQRMALAESLLLLETCLIAWLSLRFARHVVAGASRRRLGSEALFLGSAWAAALITKQNFSYMLWLLPWGAFIARCSKGAWRSQARSFVLYYSVSTLLGLMVFLPVILVPSSHDLRTRLFYKPIFTVDSAHRTRSELFEQNLVSLVSPRFANVAQWWPHDPTRPLEDGLLYLYLTPPVFLLLLLGFITLSRRHCGRALLFVAIWCMVLLGTVMAGANLLYSRYLIAGAASLILLAAWISADVLAALWVRSTVWRIRAIVVVVALAVFAWPVAASLAGVLDWRAPILCKEDRSQYFVQSSGGMAAQAAVGWLEQQALRRPITVLTGGGLGLQNDYTWLMLRDQPGVRLFCSADGAAWQPIPRQAPVLCLRSEQWVACPDKLVRLDDGRELFTVVPGMRNGRTGLMEYGSIASDPSARLVRSFDNPPLIPGSPSYYSVGVFEIDPACPDSSALPRN